MKSQINEKIRILHEKIANLRSQFPAHSIPVAMILELDELEEELYYWMTQLRSNESVIVDKNTDNNL